MTTLHVLRVFEGPDGRGGNPLGVFLDGSAIAADDRQAVAHELGYSETVFVDAIEGTAARIAIFTPATELPFAGHPTVGTAWLLREDGTPVTELLVRAGVVATWAAPPGSWIRARAAWAMGVTPIQQPTVAEVDALVSSGPDPNGGYHWAWEDEAAGRIRSRFFAPDFGIAEDEATGAAAVVMGDRLGRPLTIRQGVGSELLVRPDPAAGTVDVGGRVSIIEVRDHPA